MTSRLYMDYETRGRVDLTAAGAHVYASDVETRILMLWWALDDGPLNLWEPHKNFFPPHQLVDYLLDPSITKVSANAQFERLITYYRMGIGVPYESWRCLLVRMYYLGFFGGLDKVLSQAGLGGKHKGGTRLINLFSKPAKGDGVTWNTAETHPEEWKSFVEYGKQDLVVLRNADRWCDQFPQMPEWDWQSYAFDQRINDRGVHVDTEMAAAAVDMWEAERKRLTVELSQRTGLAKPTPIPFKEYINGLLPDDKKLDNLRKDYLTSRIDGLPEMVANTVRVYQQRESKASSKYQALLNCVGRDNRVRGMFQYKGASRTDRAGGRRLQLQNLKRPLTESLEEIPNIVGYIKNRDWRTLTSRYNCSLSEALGGAVRHSLSTPPGRTYIVADYRSIENVLIGWLTGCKTINEVFRSGKCGYKYFASYFYEVDYDLVDKQMRKFCKPPVLGCQYMLGPSGLIGYADGMGVEMIIQQSERAVHLFRKVLCPEVPVFWDWLYRSLKHVVLTRESVSGYRLTIERDEHFLRIRLPSGRNLSYYKPEFLDMAAPWDNTKTVSNFTYMGTDEKGHWCRISAHAGGVTENIIQSMGSDVLQSGISNSLADRLDVVMHTHDEIGAESPVETAAQNLDRLIKSMTRRVWWGPDLLLGAEGFISERFTKT